MFIRSLSPVWAPDGEAGAAPVADASAESPSAPWADLLDDAPGQSDSDPTEQSTPASPEPVPAEPTPVAPVVQQPAEPVAQPTPEVAARDRVLSPEWQAERLTQLESQYQFTQEQVEEFSDNPTAMLPKLAARLHLETAVMQTKMLDTVLTQVIPTLVQAAITQHHTTVESKRQVDEKVFGPYPQLRGVPEDVLMTTARAVATANPKGTPQQKLSAVAASIYAMYGWALPTAGRPTPQAPAAAAAPASYQPILPGAGAAPAAEPAKNIWDDLLN